VRLLPTLFSALVTASLAIAPAAGQEIFEHPEADFAFGGVTVPSVVDTLVVLSATRYPDPAVGIVLHYATPFDPAARFDVFVYPFRAGGAATDLAGRVQAEFGQATAEMVGYAQQNPGRMQVTMERQDPITVVTPSGEEWAGWVAEAAVDAGGTQQRTALFVFGEEQSYIKFRLTYSTPMEEQMRRRVLDFVGESLDRIDLGD
jgi:hypothetical protein